MNPIISPNTQAILLLNAPLIAGRGIATPDLLTPTEYKRLARHLIDIKREPADLLTPDAAELLHSCASVIDVDRLIRLVNRGFLLSQAIDYWNTRSIWVFSRADAKYPKRLKTQLKENAPAVLYGCGDISLLESGGFAVVGSRNVDDELTDYTASIGELCARAGKTLVSGGARGIDQAAMRGALEADGKAIGVLADSLEKKAMNREHRNLLMDDRLVLVSPYDPSAGFNVGNAMQRNKLIYALSDVALVVSSDFNKGGTWAGATEQLDKLHMVPVYVRVPAKAEKGLDALREKGAIPWPKPSDKKSFSALFDALNSCRPKDPVQEELPLLNPQPMNDVTGKEDSQSRTEAPSSIPLESPGHQEPALKASVMSGAETTHVGKASDATLSPAEALFASVRDIMCRLLEIPMNESEVAAAMEVSKLQAKKWLERLVEEGKIEKRKKAVYAVRPKGMFDES